MNEQVIPFLDFGGSGSNIHFAHANGFPPGVYQQFINGFLPNHQVIAIKHRPLWPDQDHQQLKSWHQIADDLIRFLDQRKLKNIVGMGHSLGGTASVIAAIKRPDLFRQLILIDPVIFPASYLWLNRLLPIFLRKKVVPPARIALKRKDHWASKQIVYESWRQKRVFRRIPDETLRDLVEHALVADTKEGVKLAYSKEWEAQVYMTAPYVFGQLKKLQVPMLVVRGQETNVIFESIWSKWKAAQPNNHFINYPDAGHLVPLEHPTALAQQILPLIM